MPIDSFDVELAPKYQNHLLLGLPHNSANYPELIKPISGCFKIAKILGLAKENLGCRMPPNIKFIDFLEMKVISNINRNGQCTTLIEIYNASTSLTMGVYVPCSPEWLLGKYWLINILASFYQLLLSL